MEFKEFKIRLEQLHALNKYVFILSDDDILDDMESEKYKWWSKSMQAIASMIKSLEDEFDVGNPFEYGEGIIDSFINLEDGGGEVYYERLEKAVGTKLRDPKQLFNAITNPLIKAHLNI